MASDSASAGGSSELTRLPYFVLRESASAQPVLPFFRLGDGASGANFVVTSHALKESETVKQHTTHSQGPKWVG